MPLSLLSSILPLLITGSDPAIERAKMQRSSYYPPLSLDILGAISLLLGVILATVILVDILMRKGWRSMMAIM